ncbi:pyrroline-5-carboxylate reductase [Flavobacterium sp. GT3R68]|uniref:pyrroline-5-carboxylate reductase n=1 Tax=Flavobacterium sp. GT3R68 TaxID=2594437 RepID=UPI000F87B302|nr:pyrroline-5-carboxylate reductase [Flavobacterium sp. GT3R68]RTY90838.1 pyrroline-5-carboxylate reductase [Flavobacterium sp. GSN2]TRW93830.1 pyrroline-5-carboxylate reductase [Flavobacterium sp. GT3R68]
MNIHIIGGGNLGVAIAIGLSKYSKNTNITVTRRNTESIQYLRQSGITVASDNTFQIQQADVIILAVKPHQTATVLNEIAPLTLGKMIVSAISGITIETLRQFTDNASPIFRIMPNIAIQFGASATCIAFIDKDKEQAQKVITLFADVGTVPVIEEKLMDAATVLGACGTAYALRYIRASMQAGIEIGFDSQTALAIAAQTAKGASQMLLEEKIHPEQLIDRVTTPQGCTIVGLNEMEHQGFSSSLIKGIKTSLQKITG